MQKNQKISLIILGFITMLVLLLLAKPYLKLAVSYLTVRYTHPHGRVSATKNQIAATDNILTSYFMDNGCYPTTSQGLNALLEKPKGPGTEKWAGPYTSAKGIPTDAWERELHYRCPGIHNPDQYDLWSYGADGEKGGTGWNADIGNWK